MVVGGIRKESKSLIHPLIGLIATTDITEFTLTGMRDNSYLLRMVWAGVFSITKFIRVSAGKHFIDSFNDMARDFMSVLGEKRVPMVFKDLLYSIFTCY